MMTLLEKNSLNAVEQFQPESMQLNLSERQSTATIVVGPSAPELTVDDWIRDDAEPGAGIVWRVKTVDTQYDKETRTIQLEHIINTLSDVLMFGEVKPSDMGGSTTCTAVQAISYILGKQYTWVLGTCSYDVSNPYNFNGDNLLDALQTVSSSLEDCWWDYDMSSFPFTINIVERAEAVSTELRMSRNIQTAKMSVDKTRMYTRIYPIGKNNLHIDGNYISKNENLYGRIDKTVTDQSKATKAELQRWAGELLDRHCEPSVTVTITALDLSRGTGESLDHIVLGALCRMPLPKYDTIIQETITKISYQDKIAEPDKATVTMANVREDVASIINQLIKSSGSGAKTYAKNGEEDHAWIDDTTEHVRLVAEAFIGKDGQNPVDWSRVAQLGVDQNGISGRVTATEGGLVTAQSAITANENAITAEVTRATGAESSLSGQISVEAGKISQIVTAVGEDGEVTAASICLAINQSGDSEAVIDAGKIYLLGQTIANTVTANYIDALLANLPVLHGVSASFTGSVRVGSTIYIGNDPTDLSGNLANAVRDLQIVQSGNTYILQKKDYNDSDWVDVGNFSRATTLSVGWDGNRKCTVGASPQGASRYTTIMSAIPNANVSWNGTLGTIALKATIDDGETAIDVGNVTMDVANFLQNKTGTAKFTANGTYTADSGYLGYGQIEIDVPQSGSSANVDVRFNGSSGSYYVEAFDSITGNPITGANITYKLGLSGTKVQIQDSSSNQIASTAEYQIPLQSSRTLTANGTYTPSSGNVGIASVTVNVPSDLPNAKSRFNASSGSYFIEAYDGVSGNAISNSSVTYKLGLSSNKVQIQNSSGTKYGNTPEYDISTLLTNAGYAGRAAVTLNDPTWNTITGSTPDHRTVTVTTSGRTNSSGTTSNLSKSVALYLTKGSWSSNKLTVFMRQGSTSGTVYAQTEVDASSLVTNAGYAGRAAVTLNDPTWNSYSGSMPASRTVTVSTSGRTNSSGTTANLSKAIGLYLQPGSWNGNSLPVYMREGSTSGTIRAQYTVDASARYNTGYNDCYDALYGDYLIPVWGERYENNYNANQYKTNGGTFVRKIHASANTGVHIPLSEDGANMNSENLTEIPSSGITANGNYKFRSGYAGIRYLSVNVPTGSSASYSISGHSGGSCPAGSISSALQGYTLYQTSGVPNSQSNTYRYIKFSVDGRKKAFYFS